MVNSAETIAGQAIFEAQNANQATNLLGVAGEAVAATAPPFGMWLNDFAAESSRAAAEYVEFAQAHITALGTMVPLPVIAANRIESAAGHAATAAGAVNPVGVAADAQYEMFRVQNAAVMNTYDAVATGSSTPRTYAPPPPLVVGDGAVTGDDVVNIARDTVVQNADSGGAVQGAIQQAESTLRSDPAALSGLQSAAAGAGPYASVPVGSDPMVMQQAAMAMSPAAMVAGQVAAPQSGGVTSTGLGSGSRAMSPVPTSTGGLPIASHTGSAATSAGSAAARSTPNLSRLASLLGGAGPVGSPAAPATPGSPVATARPFTGVPASSGTANGSANAHGPMGAMPPAGGKNDKKQVTTSIARLHAEDPVEEQRARERALAQFL
jgi:PPE-repeat protein